MGGGGGRGIVPCRRRKLRVVGRGMEREKGEGNGESLGETQRQFWGTCRDLLPPRVFSIRGLGPFGLAKLYV